MKALRDPLPTLERIIMSVKISTGCLGSQGTLCVSLSQTLRVRIPPKLGSLGLVYGFVDLTNLLFVRERLRFSSGSCS